LKIREFSAVFGIFAMCAFGLVFMGCGDIIQNPLLPTSVPTPTPTAADFVIENLSQEKGEVTPVTITPDYGKSEGAIFIYYDGLAILPTTSGAYAVTFDVEAATGWNAARGLAAGTLVVNDTVIDDVSCFADYLSSQAPNDKDTPYYIAIEDIDKREDFSNLLKNLNEYENKYVYIDLSRSTIEVIPQNAFYDTKNLNSGCKTLVGIALPDSVFFIGQQAFCRCVNLASVTIPDNVFYIDQQAFYRCFGLASVTMGNDVTSIESGAFQECTSLTSVIIPDSVYSIGSQAFRDCTKLSSVTFQGTIKQVNFSNNIPFSPDLPYPNDLRSKFYARDPNYGTPGTYTRGEDGWMKQP